MALLKIVALAALTVSCASSVAAPPTSPRLEVGCFLETAWGTLRVYPQGRSFDLHRAERAVGFAYRRAEALLGRSARAPRFEGHRVVVIDRGWTVGGAEYEPGTREFRIEEGREDLLEHELLHWIAWALGRPPECIERVDHPQGTDLVCKALR